MFCFPLDVMAGLECELAESRASPILPPDEVSS
jgi:hypothetical protein